MEGEKVSGVAIKEVHTVNISFQSSSTKQNVVDNSTHKDC